jgi:salicylate hydroxylase
MMNEKLRIILIGGGLAGLAAAIAMSRRGFEVSVFEQSRDIKEVGAGITMTPNAVRILRALGLENGLKERGFEPDAIVTRDWSTGRELSRISSKGETAARFGAGWYQIHRADLRYILLSALPTGILHLGARCTLVSSDERGAVVTFGDGQQAEADLIVGCDGIHSVVRDSLFARQPAHFTGNMCWRALVPANALPRGHVPRDVTIWMGRRGHVVTYYVRDNELLNVVSIRESKEWIEESWSVEAQPFEVIDAYPDAHNDLRVILDSVEHCSRWGLFDRDPLPNWTTGRVTLLGDAAHPMLPFLGQGAAMGFEDGWVLARELARSPNDVDAALARYEAERQPRTARVQIASRAQGKVYHFNSPIARLKRLFHLDRWEQQNANLLSKDWLFDYDPTVSGETSFGARQFGNSADTQLVSPVAYGSR